MRRFVPKMYTVAAADDTKLDALARKSGAGNKSAQLRMLIRTEYRRVFGDAPVLDLEPENKEEHDDE